MALTTAIFVGESKEWIPDLVAKAKQLQVNEGNMSKKNFVLKIFRNMYLSALYKAHFYC